MNRGRYIEEVDYEGYSALAMDIAEIITQRTARDKYRCNLTSSIQCPKSIEDTPTVVNVNINIYNR